MVEPDRPETTM